MEQQCSQRTCSGIGSDNGHELGLSRLGTGGRLTVVQLDDKRMVDVGQDVPLHLGPDTVPHWRTNR